MTQPFNQRKQLDPAGPLDESAGEFWYVNPWKVGDTNLSAYERNRLLLNDQGRQFWDVSHLTGGADLDSDSRGIAAGDFNLDGMIDVIVRNSGGGPVAVFENRWPQTQWLKVSLRGVKSNRLGLGAKIRVETEHQSLEIKHQSQWRELYPVCSFLSQMPSLAHFGLGNAPRVKRLTVRWPSGLEQSFDDLNANRHWQITEGDNLPREVTTPKDAHAANE